MTSDHGVRNVKVRMSGDLAAIAHLAPVLRDVADLENLRLSEASKPYPNRGETGYRVYLDILVPAAADTPGRGSA